MCIRDSLLAAGGELLLDRLAHVGAGGLDLGVRLGEALEADCLLYTSDAADERSSVDLGGRRIIKKKKDQQLIA